MTDSGKHSSGVTFFHACNCGRTQKLRDDPFDIMVISAKKTSTCANLLIRTQMLSFINGLLAV